MTIHRAKGLEFPVVVVPDLDRAPNFQGPVAALDIELGPLVQPPNDDDEKCETGMSLFAAREKSHELDERKRLLYVALTRAADYLILSSSIESHDKPSSDWMKLIEKRFDLQSGELRGTLPENYGVPSIHVHEERHETGESAKHRSRGPDLVNVLDEAHRVADDGQGTFPREVEPIPVNASARRQFSFSRLTGTFVVETEDSSTTSAPGQRSAVAGSAGGLPLIDESSPISDPRRSQGLTVDPRILGVLVHDLLARIDLNDPNSIIAWSEHLASTYVLENAAEAARTTAELASRFAASPRGLAMARADEIEREVEFILAWPPAAVGGDGSYLRGFIDCLYQDPDGRLILLDYKTDNITAADVPRAAERYAMQLYVYAIAAERALGRSPDDLVVHFLRPGVERVFEWNDENRGAAVEMVSHAIATIRRAESLQIAN
jgi:ATP-dependent helicase/nuclease subunit A